MASTNVQASSEQHTAGPSRGQNAIRVAKYGLVAGAVIGLFTGGGFMGALAAGAKVAGLGAVVGLVAGNKLNPMFDKFTSLIPGLKPKEAPAAEREAQQTELEAALAAAQAKSHYSSTDVAPKGFMPVSSVDATELENARASSSASLASAAQGMEESQHGLPDQWQSRDAAGKRVNHGGSHAVQ